MGLILEQPSSKDLLDKLIDIRATVMRRLGVSIDHPLVSELTKEIEKIRNKLAEIKR